MDNLFNFASEFWLKGIGLTFGIATINAIVLFITLYLKESNRKTLGRVFYWIWLFVLAINQFVLCLTFAAICLNLINMIV